MTEAVITKLSRFHSGLYLKGSDNPLPVTAASAKRYLPCSKKAAFPFCAHRVHFAVLKQVNFQLCVHLSGAQGVRLLLPVIAFIILNLIYHNKKRNARVFLSVVTKPSVMSVLAKAVIFSDIICADYQNDYNKRAEDSERNCNKNPPAESAFFVFDFGIGRNYGRFLYYMIFRRNCEK